jgi:DNA-binding CsgD family transcriptional regulator/PAS domain-containing protein
VANTSESEKRDLLRRAITWASSSVLDSSCWFRCIEAVTQLTGSTGSALFRPEPSPVGGNIASDGNMVAGAKAYFQHWIHHDPWNAALRGSGRFARAGEVIVGEEIVPGAAFRETAYYVDHARRYDSGHKLFLKVCDENDPMAPVTNLSLSRSFRQDNYDETDVSLVRALWPHLKSSLQAFSMLRRTSVAAALAEGSLGVVHLPCFVLRSDGQVEYMNHAAERLLQAGHARVADGRRLVGLGSLHAGVLELMLSRSARGVVARSMAALFTAPSHLSGRAIVWAQPIRQAATYALQWPLASTLFMVEMAEPSDDQAWIAGQVAPHFQLTPAETRVLQILTSGHDVAEIAAALGISVLTVRAHLRSLREKTGRSSQVALVRLGLGR